MNHFLEANVRDSRLYGGFRISTNCPDELGDICIDDLDREWKPDRRKRSLIVSHRSRIRGVPQQESLSSPYPGLAKTNASNAMSLHDRPFPFSARPFSVTGAQSYTSGPMF